MLNDPFDEAMRLNSLDDLVGREELISEKSLLGRSITQNYPISFVLWGPPGSGKTSLAKLYATSFSAPFHSFSAAKDTLSDMKSAIKKMEAMPLLQSSPIFFVDEFHRLSRVGQDFFLSFVEKRQITLLAATTENPSFVIAPAILSRLQTLTLSPFTGTDFEAIITRFLIAFPSFHFEPEVIQILKEEAKGDCRWLLWQLRTIYHLKMEHLDLDGLSALNFKRSTDYDKQGEHHYNHLSALQKSVRTSDPDGALYYLARMMNQGADPTVIFRRLIRMSIEDIGLADPNALKIALDGEMAFKRLGLEEGELSLAYVTLFLALAPKSNAVTKGWDSAKKDPDTRLSTPPPVHLLSASGQRTGYIYDHNTELGCSGQNPFPDGVEPKKFYQPVLRGFERTMQTRLDYFTKIREEFRAKKNLQSTKP